MGIETIQSYLVGLGFLVDNHGLSKFESALKQAGGYVEHYTSGAVKDLLKWQTAITGSFLSISGSIVGLADHVADQDQRFRLLGLRMFTTTESARKLQMTMDALGQPLENLIWDKELHERAMEMGSDIDRMSKQLGGNFEGNMKGIRDITFQFDRLKVAVKFLGMEFTNSLFTKLGIKDSDIVKWVDKFEADLPRISDELATNAVPILRDTWELLKGLKKTLEEFGAAFIHTVGVISGDKSLEGAQLNFVNFGKAIQDSADILKGFVEKMMNMEQAIAHLISAMADLKEGNLRGTADELQAALYASIKPPGEKYKYTLAQGAMETAQGWMSADPRDRHANVLPNLFLPTADRPEYVLPNLPKGFPKPDTSSFWHDFLWGRSLDESASDKSASPSSRKTDAGPSGSLPKVDWQAAFGSPIKTAGLNWPSSFNWQSTLSDSLPQGVSDSLAKLLRAMARQEGTFLQGTRPQRDNNPGDIEYGAFARAHGAIGSDGRFAIFPDMATGFQAMAALLSSPSYRKLTLGEALHRWDSDPKESPLYQQHIHDWTGLDLRTPMADILQNADLAKNANAAVAMDMQNGRVSNQTIIDVGGVHVHILEPGQSLDEIRAAVTESVTQSIATATAKQTQRTLAQLGGR